jgi:hypothetical protein
MSSTYYHNGQSTHRSHAEKIANHLKASYPRWVPTTELIEVTSSMNVQARITQVRDNYGDTHLECRHMTNEAFYRLHPDAPRLPAFTRDRKRMMVPCKGLTEDDREVMIQLANLLVTCREQGFNTDEMRMILAGAEGSAKWVHDINNAESAEDIHATVYDDDLFPGII